MAAGLGVFLALITLAAAILLSFFTEWWFSWFVIVGAQIPLATAVAWLIPRAAPISAPAIPRPATADDPTVKQPISLPDTPDYQLLGEPFGRGGSGKVWLVRNAVGQHQALKTVYEADFGGNGLAFAAELEGIRRYKPLSGQHPGLLLVDFVSVRKPGGYFYYVMELGDSTEEGWTEEPARYKPLDLAQARGRQPHHRFPVLECLGITIALAEALEFLHGHGLTHRDIKPSNIIFVQGRPKLADVGLVTNLRRPEEVTKFAGTAGYMPPGNEPPGTAQADIYGLGMVLYVIATGRTPALFPELSESLVEQSTDTAYMQLNQIILQACEPDCSRRYQTVAQMRLALANLTNALRAQP